MGGAARRGTWAWFLVQSGPRIPGLRLSVLDVFVHKGENLQFRVFAGRCETIQPVLEFSAICFANSVGTDQMSIDLEPIWFRVCLAE